MDIVTILKKFTLASVITLLSGLFTTFVMLNLWSWFVAPAFNLHAIFYWQMYGIYLLASYLLAQSKNATDDKRWEIALGLLKNCVPDEKLEYAHDLITKISNDSQHHAYTQKFIEIAGGAVVLGVGWFVHTFLL